MERRVDRRTQVGQRKLTVVVLFCHVCDLIQSVRSVLRSNLIDRNAEHCSMCVRQFALHERVRESSENRSPSRTMTVLIFAYDEEPVP